MKRFSKALSSVIIALLLLISGVNVTLDHLASSPTQSSFTWYDAKGNSLLTYNGDLSHSRFYARPLRVARVFTTRSPAGAVD